tara:strand:+ start:1934 stop:2569 length:636 start_codon:yes stop_codon:yes gene_type:complete
MIRLEKKYVINSNYERLRFIKFILKKGFRNIYKDRINFSIYLDYRNLKFFHDSEEGLSFRNKLRLRVEKKFFQNDYNDLNFEIKKSNPNFKKKFSFVKDKNFHNINALLEKKNFEKQIFSKKIIPILSTEYQRSYFFSNKYGRITIDTDLEYQAVTWKENFKSFNFFNKKKDKRIIIEHKLENNIPINNLITLVPTRFSKYCEGVKTLNIY